MFQFSSKLTSFIHSFIHSVAIDYIPEIFRYWAYKDGKILGETYYHIYENHVDRDCKQNGKSVLIFSFKNPLLASFKC